MNISKYIKDIVDYKYTYKKFDYHKLFKPNEKVVIFDVGANVGQSVDLFKSFFKNSIIHSFEPSSRCFKRLKENISNFDNVYANNVALGEEITKKTFYTNKKSISNSFIKINKEHEKHKVGNNKPTGKEIVNVITLDSYCKENDIDHIDILKIDTQGYEKECLIGAQNMIKNKNISFIQAEVIISNTYQRLSSFSSIEKQMKGYRLFDIFNITRFNGILTQVDCIYRSY